MNPFDIARAVGAACVFFQAQTPPEPVSHPAWGADTSWFFASTSVALMVLTVFIGVLAIVGWAGIRGLIRHQVQRATQNAHKELVGRLLGYTGFIYGKVSREDSETGERIVRPDLLDDAIHFTRRAYEELGGSEYQWDVKNNLVYYLSLSNDSMNAVNVLKLADELKGISLRKRTPAYLTTYARAILQFYEYLAEDEVIPKLKEAQRMMEGLIDNENTTPREKSNARRHLDRINAILKEQLPTLNQVGKK